MKTTKAPSTPASKSTKLADAPKSKVSPSKPEVDMKSDDTTNANHAVNSDNTVNSATPSNPDNLFGNEQILTASTTANSTTEQPKQQRICKATAQIGLCRVQGYIPCAVKAVEASSRQH